MSDAVRRAGGLPPERRRWGLLLAAAALPVLTAALVAVRSSLSLASALLLYLLVAVGVSVVGGLVAGVLAAVGGLLLANYYLTPPYHTLVVESSDSLVALIVFLVVAVTVSVLVDVAARRSAAAARSRAEAAVLHRVATQPLADRSPEDVLAEVVATYGLESAALLDGATGGVLASVGPPVGGAPSVRMPTDAGRVLVGDGPPLFAEDRRMLGHLARAASLAVDARRLAGEARRAAELAEVDRLRAALLAAVGHDLRTPLAGIKAAASALQLSGDRLAPAERAELLATVVHGADRLSGLVDNLLDLGRLEAGALSADPRPVPLDEVVAAAVLDREPSAVVVDVPDDLPLVCADPGLLERVVANLVDNALRHAAGAPAVRLSAEVADGAVLLRVVDHGAGVPEADWERMFVAFQRLDDRTAERGVGLGLAIARGFTEAMGGTLRPAHTPGGGLTMLLIVPLAAPTRAAAP